MIVPRFHLTQTFESVTLEITAKYIKLNELQFLIDGDKVFFYCNPFHLNLCLPGSLEDKVIHSTYDVDKGLLTFIMKKTIPGEVFRNLDMIIRLLSPVNEKKKLDRVLVLDDEENVFWEDTPDSAYAYGFAMKGLYDFHRIIDEYVGVLKVDPRKTDLDERAKLQLIHEQAKFDKDHYEADYAEEQSVIKDLIGRESPWAATLKISLSFDEAELDILKDLPNKDYNLTKEQREFCYTSLIDILFAYCYDCRTTGFEGNSESGWTIVEIAASLGWLSGFNNVKSAVVSGFRRSLIYPLYRNFNLSKKVFEDVKLILRLGEVCIMKCLLRIYSIFLEGDCCRYILNDIFIKDYIIYVGKWDSDEWNNVVKEVMDLKIIKYDLNMGLHEIEQNFLCTIIIGEAMDSDDEDLGAIALPDEIKKMFSAKFESRKEHMHMKLVADLGKLSMDVNDQDQDEEMLDIAKI